MPTQLKVPEVIAREIKMYPNPVKDKLIISGLSNGVIIHLQLSDATGHVVLKAATQNSTFQLKLQTLAAGVYYLNVTKDKGIPVSFKIIKE